MATRSAPATVPDGQIAQLRGHGAWERDEARHATGLVVSGYFDRAPFTERWRFGVRVEPAEPFAVPRFPRALSDYLNAVAGVGFRIAAVEEPVSDEEAIARTPHLSRWRDLAAFLLMVRAEKP